MNEFRYDDILNYEYPNEEIEQDFPDEIQRAAQFAPFAALTGHDEAIEETARRTDRRIELDEYEKEELNRRLMFLKTNIDRGMYVRITYFVPDERKNGGKYVTKAGRVKKVREYERDVVFDDGESVSVRDISEIEGDCFDAYEEQTAEDYVSTEQWDEF